MQRFSVQALDAGDEVIVQIRGEADQDCVKDLVEAFGQALAEERPVTVDCADITVLDPAAVTTLEEAREVAEACKLPFRLTAVPPPVQQALRTAGMTGLFDTAPVTV